MIFNITVTIFNCFCIILALKNIKSTEKYVRIWGTIFLPIHIVCVIIGIVIIIVKAGIWKLA